MTHSRWRNWLVGLPRRTKGTLQNGRVFLVSYRGSTARTGKTSHQPAPWSRRILALAQEGRAVDDIIDAIYAEASEAGGWLADIGVWRGLLESEVRRTYWELVRNGEIPGG
ncbi:MAG: hypothetical protein O3A93_12410 [Chloroflexi bacterium]|nr:hypothetical protein [Chloroflexota bacterium]MDA1272038.1 hypothetical protein [Chloroflexota bacterium]